MPIPGTQTYKNVETAAWPVMQYFDITELKMVQKILELGYNADALVKQILSFTEGTDYGPGTHNVEGEAKLRAILNELKYQTGSGGGDEPHDPQTTPTTVVSFDPDFVYERLTKFGITWAGSTVSYPDMFTRAEELSRRGVPSEYQGHELRLVSYLYLAGVLNIYGGSFFSADPPPQEKTLADWLKSQRLASQYGPSGNSETKTGPGGDE